MQRKDKEGHKCDSQMFWRWPDLTEFTKYQTETSGEIEKALVHRYISTHYKNIYNECMMNIYKYIFKIENAQIVRFSCYFVKVADKTFVK